MNLHAMIAVLRRRAELAIGDLAPDHAQRAGEPGHPRQRIFLARLDTPPIQRLPRTRRTVSPSSIRETMRLQRWARSQAVRRGRAGRAGAGSHMGGSP
jgi:hypothetical protein